MILNKPFIYYKNHLLIKIFLFLLIVLFIPSVVYSDSPSKKIYPNKLYCNFDTLEFKDDIEKLSSIDSISIKNKKYRSWTLNGMKILRSYKETGSYIQKKDKKRYKATISIKYDFGSCIFNAKIRQSGDYFDHIKLINGKLKQSLDVSLLEGNIAGITKFKLFIPQTRSGDSEIFITELLNKFNILSPRTRSLKVNFNGSIYKYLFQEKSGKEFVESNSHREGPIFEGAEDFLFQGMENPNWSKISLVNLENSNFIKNDIDKLKLVIKTHSLVQDVYVNYIVNSVLKNGDNIVLDYDLLSNGSKRLKEKWFIYELIMMASNGGHALNPHNRKYFWNTFENGFEPIYYDGTLEIDAKSMLYVDEHSIKLLKQQFNINNIDELIKKIKIMDKKKFYEDIKLKSVSLDKKEIFKIFDIIANNLELIKKNIISRKEKLQSSYNRELNYQKFEKNFKNLNIKLIKNTIINFDNRNNKVILKICHEKDCKLSEKTILEIINMINQPNIKNGFNYIDYKSNDKTEYENIIVNSKNIKVKRSPGLKINIMKNNIIYFSQTHKTDWGVIYDSNIEDISINFQGSDKGETNNGLNNYNITDCLTFYNVNFDNVNINSSNSFCEDSINIINSRGNINNITIEGSQSDALDIDFSRLNIKNIEIKNALNDCTDFSSGDYKIEKIKAINCGDKAMSIGENSKIEVKYAEINNANMAIASKDSSKALVKTLNADNIEICFAAYNKKNEFNGGYLHIEKANCRNYKKLKLTDNLSKIEIKKDISIKMNKLLSKKDKTIN